MKGESERTFWDVFFILHFSGPAYMFLLQALG